MPGLHGVFVVSETICLTRSEKSLAAVHASTHGLTLSLRAGPSLLATHAVRTSSLNMDGSPEFGFSTSVRHLVSAGKAVIEKRDWCCERNF